ncbi:hypothetical protein B0T17DRAFT_32140 [Bombardia bombarda]|uniref:Uncharacterized protein n=1 Tax=Bombardia bombarda TaxID=252184 RepID=A0AA39XKT3_9PEZI|nr:hypothetical protein B0T17DRAFT_32140 [Bombardia bombarda]
MGFSSLFPVALFSVAVHGLMNPTPRATDKVVSLDNVQLPQPTVPPSIHELVRRQADGSSITVIVGTDNTCGYISGTKARPLICTATTRQCAFVPAQGIIPGFAGCCDNLDCEVALGCYDREAVSASECDGECMDNLYITKWYCSPLTVDTSRVESLTYAQHRLREALLRYG